LISLSHRLEYAFSPFPSSPPFTNPCLFLFLLAWSFIDALNPGLLASEDVFLLLFSPPQERPQSDPFREVFGFFFFQFLSSFRFPSSPLGRSSPLSKGIRPPAPKKFSAHCQLLLLPRRIPSKPFKEFLLKLHSLPFPPDFLSFPFHPGPRDVHSIFSNSVRNNCLNLPYFPFLLPPAPHSSSSPSLIHLVGTPCRVSFHTSPSLLPLLLCRES